MFTILISFVSLTYLLSFLLTRWSRVLPAKLTVFQTDKKFPAFYGTRRFITAFTSARHLFLSWASSISPSQRHTFMFSKKARFLRWGIVSISPNPQSIGPPLVGRPRLPIQYIRNCPPYWRSFLHRQPEDAPCRGDRDPLITGSILY